MNNNITFKPEAMQNKIAPALGYKGQYDEASFQKFLQSNPEMSQKYEQYKTKAYAMAKGGYVRKYDEGGAVTPPTAEETAAAAAQEAAQAAQTAATTANSVDLGSLEESRLAGQLPTTAVTTPTGIPDSTGNVATGTGQVTNPALPISTSTANTAQAATNTQPDTATTEPQYVTPEVQTALNDVNAEQGIVTAEIEAAQQGQSSVSQLESVVGEGIYLNNQITREIQAGEIIDGVANAEKAAAFTASVQAATADPSRQATVKGQLEDLYDDFDGVNPPAWAAGAMRAATAAMASRGLLASSLAGQAVVQATMESALPIAQADASVFGQFELTNLSNRQQRSMLAAQQRAAFIGQEFDQAFQSRVANAARVADVANLNFTADQQIQLENSRIANTMNLQNLNSKQALVMAEAAALSNLDLSNLNNRQQSAVQNAQNFLQMDLANLSARQQTAIFEAQSVVQSLFTDAAAANASEQFNATSENQTNQFFASLDSQVRQFNAAQSNAIGQFNAGQDNATNQFALSLQNQREQFNSQNELVIAQSNAQWRRQIATADTAAINRANEVNAAAALGISTQAYDNVQQYMRDIVFKAIQSQENALDREQRIASAIFNANSAAALQSQSLDATADGNLLTSITKGLGGLFEYAGTDSGSEALKSAGSTALSYGEQIVNWVDSLW